MLKKMVALAVVITVIAIAIVSTSRRTVTQGQGVDPATLSGMALQAQAEGRSELGVARNIMFVGVNDLTSALSTYTVVDAVASSKQSYALDEFNIGTWYKFTLNYTIKQNPIVACTQCSSNIPDPPQELLPLNSNEILVLHPGGSATVEGIPFTVTVPEFPDFNLSQRYLLFLDFDANRKVGTVSVGPPGVYLIDSSGNLIHVYDATPDDPIGSGLAASYGSNANTLRNALNPPPGCDPALQQSCYDDGGTWDAATCHCQMPFDPCLKKPWLCE